MQTNIDNTLTLGKLLKAGTNTIVDVSGTVPWTSLSSVPYLFNPQTATA